MAEIHIKDININIWNHQKVQFSAHSDVNIIMGINGSGKTTFLNNLYKALTESKKNAENVVYLPSIDNIAMRDKRKTATALSQDLDYYIYDMKTGPSLMSLRMSLIDSSEEQQAELKLRIAEFQKAVNTLFALTHTCLSVLIPMHSFSSRPTLQLSSVKVGETRFGTWKKSLKNKAYGLDK